MAIDTLTQAHKVSVRTGLAATGTDAATAYILARDTQHEFTDVPAGSGCVLPVPSFPCGVKIHNAGANPLLVYPPAGGTLSGGAKDAPVSLDPGTGVSLWASSLTNYYADLASSPGGEAGVPEAPEDGGLYGRRSAAWAAVPPAGIPEAPSDGQLYARRNGAWVVIVIPPAGIADAPSNGSLYGRMNAAWSIVPPAP
jgi:hypothetical protein